MGWNDHVDWDLINDFDFLVQEGELDDWEEGSIEQMVEIVKNVAYGAVLAPADQVIFKRDIEPLLGKVEDLRERTHFEYLLSKDD
jgi:hypothetical protein